MKKPIRVKTKTPHISNYSKMKNKGSILLIVLMLVSFFSYSTGKETTMENVIESANTFPDSIKIGFMNSLKVINLSENKDSNTLSGNMPWIVALLIGILSFVLNLIITNKSNKLNSMNLTKQIDSAKEISRTDFKAKLKTENMQKWMDDLREYLSEYLSNCAIVRSKIADLKNKPDKEVYNAILNEFKMMVKYKIKLLTMLNLEIHEHLVVAEQINELFKMGFVSIDKFTATEHIDLENKLLSDMRTLVNKYWEEISNIEK